MLSIDYIRENKQKVLDALKNKNREADIDGILTLDEERKKKIQEAQVLREERNRLAKQKFTEETKTRGKEIKELLKTIEGDLAIIEEKLNRVSGYRGYFLKNQGAILHMALLLYVFKKLTLKGYTPMIAPAIIKKFTLFGSGHLPWGEKELYKLNGEDDDAYLSATAEIPITSYFSNEILQEKDLPKKFVAFSPCFRSEGGPTAKTQRAYIEYMNSGKLNK
ncbi:MAG: hypothetical protein NTV98_01820 [Candidatus Roizmanbacteria bacterium]|nr:hypothetical protein [Candidatus Roizmanbacteria bacterium]